MDRPQPGQGPIRRRERLYEPELTGHPSRPAAPGTRLLDPRDADGPLPDDTVFPVPPGHSSPDNPFYAGPGSPFPPVAFAPARGSSTPPPGRRGILAGRRRPALVIIAAVLVLALAVTGWALSRRGPASAPALTPPTPTPALSAGAQPSQSVAVLGEEVGVRFAVTAAGTAGGLRFLPAGPSGEQVVMTLWTADGQQLGRGVAGAAGRDGWRQASFPKPVALQTGKQYVASYFDQTLTAPPAAAAAAKRKAPVSVLGLVQHQGAGFPAAAGAGDLPVDLIWTPAKAPAPKPSSSAAAKQPGKASGHKQPAKSSGGSKSGTAPGAFPGGTGKGCAAAPSSCGFPDASNTGVRAGVKLKASGSVAASRDGQVVEGLDITGEINVTASNVTIRNTRVTGGGDWVVVVRPGANNLTIEDSELRTPAGTPQDIACVLNIGDSLPTILRTDIHSCSAGVSSGGGLVKDSYIHDMAQKPGLSHDVGVASNGTGGMQVIHNTIFNQLDQTATVAFYQDFDVQRNDLVQNNLLAGGGYCVYGGKGEKGTATNIRFVNNRFSRKYAGDCGHFGVVASFDENASGNEWTGNRWDDTLAAVN